MGLASRLAHSRAASRDSSERKQVREGAEPVCCSCASSNGDALCSSIQPSNLSSLPDSSPTYPLQTKGI